MEEIVLMCVVNESLKSLLSRFAVFVEFSVFQISGESWRTQILQLSSNGFRGGINGEGVIEGRLFGGRSRDGEEQLKKLKVSGEGSISEF